MSTLDGNYYTNLWGFNPLKYRTNLNTDGTCYRYEKEFQFFYDNELFSAGVTLSARVNVIWGRIELFVVFKQQTRENIVKILPSLLFDESMVELQQIGVSGFEKHIQVKSPQTSQMSPEEQFIVLKAFVEQLAKVGIRIQIAKLCEHGQKTYPLRQQFLQALYELVPQEVVSITKKLIRRAGDQMQSVMGQFPNIEYALKFFLIPNQCISPIETKTLTQK